MNAIELDIYRGIDMAFHWFKKNNPNLEKICDEDTMNQWYDFLTWCYAQDGETEAEDILLDTDNNFNFEISPLMQDAIDECSGWWCKYNIDHQQTAEEESGFACDNCEGTGYMDENYDKECDECDATGKDQNDEESYWDAYEEAFSNISNSVDTSFFEKLSKIEIK